MREAARVLAAGLAAAALLAAPAGAQEWRNVTSARQLQGEQALDVRVEYGAGRLTVGPAAEGLLYRMQLRYDERMVHPVSEYRDGVLRLGVESSRRNQRIRRGGTAAIGLVPSVPTELRLDFGAGEAEVELGGMAVRRLDVSTGASETRLRFSHPNRVDADAVAITAGAASVRATGLGNARAAAYRFDGGVGDVTLGFDGAWTRDATLDVEMGLGSLALRFPRGLGVRIRKDSFLTSFSPSGMVRRGDAWYSRDWDTAQHRLTVDIQAALGSIDVQWTDR